MTEEIKKVENGTGWRGSLIALAVSTAVAVILLEIALRVLPAFMFLDVNLPTVYRADEERGWALQPNVDFRWNNPRFEGGWISIRTDENGCRVGESEVMTGSDAKTILFLGDSFTMGWGVHGDEMFTTLVQNGLNEISEAGEYRSVNSGVPGYGTENEYQTLMQLFDDVKPDIVVLGFTENDFENVVEGLNYRAVHEGMLISASDLPKLKHRTGRQKFNSFVKNSSYMARLIFHFKKQAEKDPAHEGELDGRRFWGYTLEVLRTEPTPEVVKAVEKTRDILEQMKDFLTARDVSLLVVSFPRSYQIYTDELLQRIESTGENPDDFTADLTSRYIKTACEELEIHFVGLTGAFVAEKQAGKKRNELFIRNDGHWTAEGHQVAAQRIVKKIESLWMR